MHFPRLGSPRRDANPPKVEPHGVSDGMSILYYEPSSELASCLSWLKPTNSGSRVFGLGTGLTLQSYGYFLR